MTPIEQCKALIFWDKIASCRDTHGVPTDLIAVQLRSEGMRFTDTQLDGLLAHLISRRNKITSPNWIETRSLLIPLGKVWQ